MSERSACPSTVLVKLSGEALCAPGGAGFDPSLVREMAAELGALAASGVRVGVVVGGGNLVRGRDLPSDLVARTDADAAGMLATIANSLVLVAALRSGGFPARLLTAVPMPDVGASFTARAARESLDAGEVLVLGGGTGRPFFTTDTAAALRALEIGADLLVKVTTVDGVYDRDPKKDPAAKRFRRLTWDEVLARRLEVMDRTAFTLCAENRLAVVVCAARPAGRLARVVAGEAEGTRIG